jgi:hypothetical protein
MIFGQPARDKTRDKTFDRQTAAKGSRNFIR